MTGNERHLVPQPQQLALDRLDQRRPVTVRKVASSNRPLEYGVTDQGEAALRIDEHHVAGGVARDVQHFEPASGHLHHVPFRQEARRHRVPLPRLLVVGAVHVAQALGTMAQAVGLSVIVIDPRESFATPARFPGIPLDTRWPDEAVLALRPDPHTAVVALAHDPKLDDPALRVALNSPAFFVGALGSRRTQATRRLRLQADGVDTARLRGPVGLAIGAVGAPEIALSILAEIVAVRRGGILSDRRGWQD